MTALHAPAAALPDWAAISDDGDPQARPCSGRQDLYWDTDALPDGHVLAAAAARLLTRLSALAAQWDGDRGGRPGPVPDPQSDKAAALTLIKAAHQLLCATVGVRAPAGAGAGMVPGDWPGARRRGLAP